MSSYVEVPLRRASADRLYPARPFLASSIAVVRGDRVLVAVRANGPMAGRFSLPGGLVEAGETMAAAALRELREEVGVDADVVGFLDHAEIIERDERGRVLHHFVIAAHAARWIAGEPRRSAEALDVRWVDADEAARLPTTPGLGPIVSKALRVAVS
jgi:ADP-ribose pyrophosphatase YjhB (NUDIX family)